MDGDRSIPYLRFTIRGGGGSAGISWAGKATIKIHMDNKCCDGQEARSCLCHHYAFILNSLHCD